VGQNSIQKWVFLSAIQQPFKTAQEQNGVAESMALELQFQPNEVFRRLFLSRHSAVE
jgi:hypothetical protein